ncbi:MAG: DUF1572 domain-containing protein [Luteitalea sp.]|nr:DUF1572 domain-containing protein [Luteitalea sp.]
MVDILVLSALLLWMHRMKDSTSLVESILAEYLRYKALAEGAIGQLADAELCASGPNGGNSIAVICWHVSGNLRSRFTDFLTSDGEKPWRQREEEFEPRTVTRAELLSKWDQGWDVLFHAMKNLDEAQLGQVVTIRGQPLRVHEALHRSLAHVAYHVGQIVYLARSVRGDQWRFLSIPPGGSEAYNQNPTSDRPAAHGDALARSGRREQT